ncbi:hypothetical protein TELCIR_00930 [Teladorsagia circumcincta]|uniref:Uncharacterized protein n=1 Tax=Teladorsagia circumcincta TaxID=45464 RepID=A0A2G9V4T7_TELCI|nr:hypothetical protein TELCIR_00930 [Teladorsagia circumcincta]
MRISTLSEGGLEQDELTGEDGAPATARRITSFIDSSASANPLLVRKRKLAMSSSPIDIVRARKN